MSGTETEVPVVPVPPDPPTAPVLPVVPAVPTVDDIGKYEEAKANRQLKHWVIKVIVGVVALMFSLICAAFIYSSVVKSPNGNTDPSVIKAFLDTLLEMFKIMKN